jgi:hypothetical protein
MLDDQGDRAPRHRVGGEVVSIAREAGDAEEQGAGFDEPVVVRETADPKVAGARRRRAGQNLIQPHRSTA